ncbi:hypothetical protein [Acinetobacter phage NJ01]|nr:hypothetical protein [Acinetobacter phage NJ01]
MSRLSRSAKPRGSTGGDGVLSRFVPPNSVPLFVPFVLCTKIE